MGVGWGKEKEVREYEKDVMRNVRQGRLLDSNCGAGEERERVL